VTHNVQPLLWPTGTIIAAVLACRPSASLSRAMPIDYKTALVRANLTILYIFVTVLSTGPQPQQRRISNTQDRTSTTVISLERASATARARPEEKGQAQSRREPWTMGVLQYGQEAIEHTGGGLRSWYVSRHIIQVASIGKGRKLIAINVARASMVRRRAPAQIVGRPA